VCHNKQYSLGLPLDFLTQAKRRNKWICALKTILGELKIYGPSGDPNPPPPVSRYAKVPWDIIEEEDRKAALEKTTLPVDDQRSSRDWKLDDKNAALRKPHC